MNERDGGEDSTVRPAPDDAGTVPDAQSQANGSGVAPDTQPPADDTGTAPDIRSTDDERLRHIHGAVYLPQKDWNAYQLWANYENAVVERDLDYAARLGLNSLRVLASYEYWREDGPSFFAHVEHFLSTCRDRGIRPMIALFEAAPEDPPTEQNLHATDPDAAFGVHSPSRPEILQPRHWKGYARSPIHFTHRWAEEFATDDRLLATEVMNEPGDVQPRRDFVLDALRTIRSTTPDATLTMGTKDVKFAERYDRPDLLDGHRGLDAYQFHMNLPRNPDNAVAYATRQRKLADELSSRTDIDDLGGRAGSAADTDDGPAGPGSKPLWCTEWQRTLDEPPSRFAPNLASLAPTIRRLHESGTIDGDFFWSLMVRPAYLRRPRQRGRFNGLFHADGTVYSRSDAEAVFAKATGGGAAFGRSAASGRSAAPDNIGNTDDVAGHHVGANDEQHVDADDERHDADSEGRVGADDERPVDAGSRFTERHEPPSSWRSHQFPYPVPGDADQDQQSASTTGDRDPWASLVARIRGALSLDEKFWKK